MGFPISGAHFGSPLPGPASGNRGRGGRASKKKKKKRKEERRKKRQTAPGRTWRDRRYAPSVGTAAQGEGALGVPEEDQRTARRLILFLETTSILSWTGGSRLPASPLLSSPLPPSLFLSVSLSLTLTGYAHDITASPPSAGAKLLPPETDD